MADLDKCKKALAIQHQMLKSKKNIKVYFPDKTQWWIWHVTFKGADGSDFQGGLYHFYLDLKCYPDGAPVVKAVNENGSITPNVAICLAGITHYHPEAWTPGTSIEAICDALACYMLSDDRHGIGFLPKLDKPIIKKAMEASKKYVCPQCKADHTKDFQ